MSAPVPFLTMINPLRRRRSVPLDLFYAYWRDAHVQIASRLPGIDDLFIHQLAFEEAGPWPRVPGVAYELAPDLRFEGVPEPTFATATDLERFIAHMAPLMDDEVNIFEETISYQSLGANSRTLRDELGEAAPDGDPHLVRYLVFLQQAEGIDQPAFRDFVADELGPALAADERVRKLRLHLFEPLDDDALVLDARGVSHVKAPEHRYQGLYEIAFAGPLDLARFARAEAWTGSLGGQRTHLRGAHPFRVLRSYTMKLGGRPTLSGLRTPAVAEQITRLGALNQLEPEVAQLVETGSPAGSAAT